MTTKTTIALNLANTTLLAVAETIKEHGDRYCTAWSISEAGRLATDLHLASYGVSDPAVLTQLARALIAVESVERALMDDAVAYSRAAIAAA